MLQIFFFVEGLIRVPSMHIMRHRHRCWLTHKLQTAVLSSTANIKEVELPEMKFCWVLLASPIRLDVFDNEVLNEDSCRS